MTGLEPIWIGAAAKGLTDIVVKPISEVLNRRLDEPFRQLLFNVFQRYIQNYADRHGLLKVLGMTEAVKLEEIYTAVQFLDSQGIWQFDPNRMEKAYRDSQKRRFQSQQCKKRDGLQVANAQQYLMVLGQPGAGKSTFLRRIGLEALKGQSGSYRHKCVPVFLELKQFRTGEVNLEQAIAHEFETCGFPDPIAAARKMLANGQLLILLDGLDEVPTQQLDIAIDQIQNFADQYKKNRFIASCRTAAYQSRFQKFVDVTMADFDDAQIQQFIHNWFRTEKDREAKTAERCWDLLQEPSHTATKELAQTPLLLTLLCLVFDDSQNFPEKRAELYKQALDVLLTKWAAEKRVQRDPIYKELTLTLETIMLGEIAYGSFAADRLFFSRQEVVDQIRGFLANNLNTPRHLDGEVILQAIQIQQGILVERANNVLSFSHLTFQEYLSAQYIADQDRADNPLIAQLLHQYLTEKRWREVWLLLSGLMRGGGDPLLLQMERQAQTYLISPTLKDLIDWADRATQESEGNYKPVTKRILALTLALALDHAIDLDLAIAIAIDYYAIAIDYYAIDYAIVRDHAIDRARVLDHAIDRIIDLVRVFAKIKVFKSVDFPNLFSQMESLKTSSLSSESSSLEEDFAYLNQIFLIWGQSLHVDSNCLDLSETEIKALNEYLYANELIVRCKEVAMRVSPQTWAGIESRMLTLNSPPIQFQDIGGPSSSPTSTAIPQPNPPLSPNSINLHFHGPTYGVAGVIQDDQNIHPTE
ncbi:MAG: NACHT domain-containing protein [Thermosynechococcaceae cyanobacterium]